jgi:hypothetical protein
MQGLKNISRKFWREKGWMIEAPLPDLEQEILRKKYLNFVLITAGLV